MEPMTIPKDNKPKIFNLGVNFRSADVTFRESLFIPENRLSGILANIKAEFELDELCVISTCNRFEMFGVNKAEPLADDKLHTIFLGIQSHNKISSSDLKQNAYIHRNHTAIHHLVSVASSLDSLVVGETQITGQFKKAINIAREANTLGPIMDRLSQDALACSKKIRRNTRIGEKTVSISHAAIDLAKKIFGSISEQKILVIGAGEMSRLAYEYATLYKPESLVICNRTYEHAKAIVDDSGYGSAHGMDELETLLEEADIVISSTSATKFIITKGMLENIQKNRKKQTMFLCDIAIPRDIEPACTDIEEIFLFEVDDLQQVVDENIEERKVAAKEAATYVDSTTNRYVNWLNSQDYKTLLNQAKTNLDELFDQETSKTMGKTIFSSLDKKQKDEINKMQKAIASKIVGQVAEAINTMGNDDRHYNVITALMEVFKTKKKK